MTANEPRPNEEMGRVLPFQRKERARPPAPAPQQESPVADLEKYAQDNQPDDYDTASVRTAARYYEHNLGWTQVAGYDTRGRALRLPAELTEPAFEDFRPF